MKELTHFCCAHKRVCPCYLRVSLYHNAAFGAFMLLWHAGRYPMKERGAHA